MPERPPEHGPDRPAKLEHIRFAREWTSGIEAALFANQSPMQRVLEKVEHGELTGIHARVELTGALVEAQNVLTALYRKHLVMSEAEWAAALRELDRK